MRTRKTFIELLKEYSLPLQEIADSLGVDINVLHKWADLKKRPVETIIKIHRVTSIPYVELIGLELKDTGNNSFAVIDKLRENKELNRLSVNESRLLNTIEQQSETIKQQSSIINKQLDIINTLASK